MRHGDPPTVTVAGDYEMLGVWLGPDPTLAFVHADMHAYLDAHPCDCEALCECDAPDR